MEKKVKQEMFNTKPFTDELWESEDLSLFDPYLLGSEPEAEKEAVTMLMLIGTKGESQGIRQAAVEKMLEHASSLSDFGFPGISVIEIY